jgi:hypothetical protein
MAALQVMGGCDPAWDVGSGLGARRGGVPPAILQEARHRVKHPFAILS